LLFGIILCELTNCETFRFPTAAPDLLLRILQDVLFSKTMTLRDDSRHSAVFVLFVYLILSTQVPDDAFQSVTSRQP